MEPKYVVVPFESQVSELVNHTEYTLGPVNILVNNAGIMYYTMMKNLKEDEWNKQVDLNVKVNLQNQRHYQMSLSMNSTKRVILLHFIS